MKQAGGSPWLSVLVPVYNVAGYLQQCVESVLSQAGDGVEVLLLDDCSTDASAALMASLQQRWPQQISLHSHSRNRGLSAARNTMLERCRGDYVWFVDSDDFLVPGAIAALAGAVRQGRPDLVLCDFRLARSRQRLKHRLRGENHRHSFNGQQGLPVHDRVALLEGLLSAGQLHAWSKIARRGLWLEHGLRYPEGAYFEDMATMPLLALQAQSFIYVPQVWLAYRQRSGSILSAMNTQKAVDLSDALGLFSQRYAQLAAQQRAFAAPQLAFALAHLLARNYLGALRAVSRQGAGEGADAQTGEALRRRFAGDFMRNSPLTPAQLLQGYLRRGWLSRYLRARRPLLQAARWHGQG